jgi:CRISPR system Cascade subunit CasD
MEALVLRLEAPLMSFGGPMVDNYGVVQTFPAVSLLTGLIGNALGIDHREPERLTRLQDRIRFAVRLDRPGEPVVDYQTVDLGQDHMQGTGWTTWEEPEERGGGSAKEMTHIRYRHYRADAMVTVILALDPVGEQPGLEELAAAFKSPARPLFIGRKACIPATPILAGHITAPSFLKALRIVARAPGSTVERPDAQWPIDEDALPGSRIVSLTDERDWVNQIHAGERFVRQGQIELAGEAHG